MMSRYVFDRELFQLVVQDVIGEHDYRAVARECGVVGQTVLNWASGQNCPQVDNFVAFCHVAGKHPLYFLKIAKVDK